MTPSLTIMILFSGIYIRPWNKFNVSNLLTKATQDVCYRTIINFCVAFVGYLMVTKATQKLKVTMFSICIYKYIVF